MTLVGGLKRGVMPNVEVMVLQLETVLDPATVEGKSNMGNAGTELG